MRKQVELNCTKCNKLFMKDLSEVKRNKSLNRLNYCSLSCASDINKIPPNKRYNIKHLNAANRIDEFTGFRYYLKLTKNRNRKFSSISLEDIKLVWENQKGICPYTNLKLVLQTHSKKHYKFPFYIWASLDRIDSMKPYTLDNVEFVSLAINLMKNKYEKKQVLDFLKILKNLEQDANSGN